MLMIISGIFVFLGFLLVAINMISELYKLYKNKEYKLALYLCGVLLFAIGVICYIGSSIITLNEINDNNMKNLRQQWQEQNKD